MRAAHRSDGVCARRDRISTSRRPMAKAPQIRLRFSDGTSMDLPEMEPVQVVTQGPSETAEEGWQRLNPDAKPAMFGKVSKVRAAALARGQHLMTFRGLLLIDGARRI